MTQTMDTTPSSTEAGGPAPEPDAAMAWSAFEARLVASLTALPARGYLILEHDLSESDDGSHFVQFARRRGGLLAEAVSNLYLTGDRLLDAGQEAALAALGWEAPHPRSKYRRNWSHRWRTPTPDAEAAALAIRTLREAYRVASPGDLRLRRFTRAGEDLPDPALGPRLVDALERAVVAWGTGRVDRVVEAALASVVADPVAIERPDPGRWRITVEGIGIWVQRLDERPPLVRVYAEFLGAVHPGPGLFEMLNAVNTRMVSGRVLWVDGALVVADEVKAPGLSRDGLVLACLGVSRAARRLAAELGAGMQPLPGVTEGPTLAN
jgi:hypothetical protein